VVGTVEDGKALVEAAIRLIPGFHSLRCRSRRPVPAQHGRAGCSRQHVSDHHGAELDRGVEEVASPSESRRCSYLMEAQQNLGLSYIVASMVRQRDAPRSGASRKDHNTC
jgi:hypothetical protein